MDAQSAVGVSDGAFRVLLDGVEASLSGLPPVTGVAQNKINWYESGAPTRLFSGLQFFLYWGGSNNTKAANDYVDLSEFYITGRAANH